MCAVESFDDALQCLRRLVRACFVCFMRCVSSYLESVSSCFEINTARKGYFEGGNVTESRSQDWSEKREAAGERIEAGAPASGMDCGSKRRLECGGQGVESGHV